MTYTCPDFMDDIMRTLAVELDPNDDGEDRIDEAASLACTEIKRLQKSEKDGVAALQLVADLWDLIKSGAFPEKKKAQVLELQSQVQALKLPPPTIPF